MFVILFIIGVIVITIVSDILCTMEHPAIARMLIASFIVLSIYITVCNLYNSAVNRRINESNYNSIYYEYDFNGLR